MDPWRAWVLENASAYERGLYSSSNSGRHKHIRLLTINVNQKDTEQRFQVSKANKELANKIKAVIKLVKCKCQRRHMILTFANLKCVTDSV